MSKTDTKKLPSWREAYRLNQRAFLLIFKSYPSMMTSRIVRLIFDSLIPYLNIYLSALIIDEIAGDKDPERLKQLVIITLLSSAATSLTYALLSKWRNAACAGMYYKIEMLFTKKLLEMDFADVSDTNTHKLLSTIRQNQNSGGWGLQRVITNYETLAAGILSLIGGVSLSVTLFTSKVPESAGKLTIMNRPLFIVLIIAVMLSVTYLSPALSTKAGKYNALNADSHRIANRLFSFFGFLGIHPNFATDVRMYRQDLICEKYNQDKTAPFCSKGLFAKYSRGPAGLFIAASSSLSVIFTGTVYLFVCLKAWAGAFGVGAITQYVGSITKLSGKLASLISIVGHMRNNAAFLKLVFEFFDIPNKMYQGCLTVEKRADRDYEVEFKDVSFKYPGSNDYALKNVNIKFRIGERLAVVGQNGSGKTTFIKLLCRLYDPTEGEILLNGINIKKYNYLDYMSVFSIVFQDFRLFAFELGQNVAACVDYDKALAEECLSKAGFKERLNEMPNGLETFIYKNFSKEGVDISGGEAQKIALARALYKNAPFIILDEPTAALDPIAEAEIYSKFNDIVDDKTAIYISHRLSSCRFCDSIAVFDNGHLVQTGSHEQLVTDECGKYHELWHAQAQYYA